MTSVPQNILVPKILPLVGDLKVGRIMPRRERRSVGPFVFLDHMGPHPVLPTTHADVPPHPHIGLATVTYLFDGALVHRDSVGSVQTIVPGDVNWMHAGHGVVHSERLPADAAGSVLHGLQAWVGLPLSEEESEPWFHHHPRASLPQGERDGVGFALIAGELWGAQSPVQVTWPMVYAELHLQAGSTLQFTPTPGHEAALYLMRGTLEVAGTPYTDAHLLAYGPDAPVQATARTACHAMLLGGAPLDGAPRLMDWNFVASSKERLDAAKTRWKQQRFPKIAGETEFVPLPPQGH